MGAFTDTPGNPVSWPPRKASLKASLILAGAEHLVSPFATAACKVPVTSLSSRTMGECSCKTSAGFPEHRKFRLPDSCPPPRRPKAKGGKEAAHTGTSLFAGLPALPTPQKRKRTEPHWAARALSLPPRPPPFPLQIVCFVSFFKKV